MPCAFGSAWEQSQSRGNEKIRLSAWIGGLPEQAVITQAILRDGDGIVLLSDSAAVVELWHTGRIVGSRIIGLLREKHVVFAEFVRACSRIFRWRFVPKRQMAVPAAEIGAEDAAIVGEARQSKFVEQK